MSVIVQQPDSLSFAGNLKKFVVTSAVAVALQLNKGAEQILNEVYQPSSGNLVEIDLRTVIDKVLSVTLPGTALITEQSSGFADFTATIDGTAVAFRVIKGGVLELGSMASAFVNEHFLTWQIQNKTILQHQPEWLTVYTNAGLNLNAKAYYQDNTNASMLLTALAAGKLLAVDVSWASINALFVKKNPIAWDVWFEDLAGTRLSYVQRYCLRNSDDEEKIFIWANTLGGIDSISLTGSAEDDKKLEHLIAEMGNETLQEYQTDKKREIKQSTGFLTVDESRWIEDFFYSGRRYLVGEDGAVRSIVLASSKIVGSTADDLFDYEFNYRLASESQLLNLDRSFESLPALEVPVDFFLTELLSGLPVAQYADSLLMAVQSPFAQAWQKLSMAQLWGSALPGFVDGTTISVVNGKLQVNGVSGGVGVSTWGDLTEKPFNSLSNLFSVSPEGVLTLANTYALLHTHPYLSDADARIANWNNAFTWGNHAIAGYAAAHTHPYRPDTWVPTWTEVSAKPVWTEKMGWDGTAVTVSTDVHITGKLVVDGTIQFFGAGAGGTGGGGASALWELTDVADDMQNSIYGDLPMYNGTHFARYNISNFALAGHLHSIAQVNGLQSALDGKQFLLGYTPYYSANFVAGVNYSAPHSHPYLSDADARIANWNNAFTWGNHATAGYAAAHTHPYRPDTWVPSWADVSVKPTWTEKMGWDGSAVTIAGDLHVTGKIISDGSMQFYGISSGGSGGGGSTTLWGLSDVSDDVANAINGDLIMYNGTHFARINQSALAPAIHTHTIGQVTGLQTALDGKSPTHFHPYLSDSDVRIAQWNIGYTHSQTTHNKAFVGLSNVDNTTDITKSVAFSAVAETANFLQPHNPVSGTDMNTVWKAGIYSGIGAVNCFSPGDYGILNIPTWAGTNENERYNLQIGSTPSGELYYRSTGVSGAGTWKIVWNNSNFTPANYLPLIGGALTGSLFGTTASFGSIIGGNLAIQNPNYGTTGDMGGISFKNTYPQNWEIAKITYGLSGQPYYGYIAFHTVRSGYANTLDERMRIAQDGTVSIWGNTETSGLKINGIGSNTTTWITNDNWSPSNTVTLRLGNYHSTYKNYSPYIRSSVLGGIDQYNLSFGASYGAEATDRLVLNPYGAVFSGTINSGAIGSTGAGTFSGIVTSWGFRSNSTDGVYFKQNSGVGNWQLGSDGTVGSGCYLYNESTGLYALKLSAGGIGTFYGGLVAPYLTGTASNASAFDNMPSSYFVYGASACAAIISNSLDVNTVYKAGFYAGYQMTNSMTTGDNGFINIPVWAGDGPSSRYNLQIGSALQSDNLTFRTTSVAGAGTWRYVWHNGNLNRSDASFAALNITASGNIIANGTIQFYTASDRRLKTDFEIIADPISKIKSLTGYFFNYTDQAMQLGGYTSRRDIGLIAQDVHNILPEATGTLWGTDFMGYKADKLAPLFVEGFKQQDTRMMQYDIEIRQLKQEINNLKQQRA